jgi:pimeloyl-ACP methyl ester carboxylesterase
VLRRLVLIAVLAVMTGPATAGAFEAQVKRVTLPDGTSIAWYERGSGQPLLLNMGSASTMGEWDPALLRELAGQHRLILWDYRGMGLSRGSLRGLTMDRLADDAAEFLGAIGVRRADVLGWSLGGFVAQRMAVRHPDRVRRMVLAGTNPGGPATVLGPEWAQAVDSDPDRSGAAVMRTLYPNTPAGRAAGRAFLNRLDTAAETGEIPDDFTVPRAGFDAQIAAEERWMASAANLRQLRSLRIAVLVAGGSRDVLTPPANDATITRAIPRATRTSFASGGHAFLFQFAPQFSREVTAFLRSGAE